MAEIIRRALPFAALPGKGTFEAPISPALVSLSSCLSALGPRLGTALHLKHVRVLQDHCPTFGLTRTIVLEGRDITDDIVSELLTGSNEAARELRREQEENEEQPENEDDEDNNNNNNTNNNEKTKKKSKILFQLSRFALIRTPAIQAKTRNVGILLAEHAPYLEWFSFGLSFVDATHGAWGSDNSIDAGGFVDEAPSIYLRGKDRLQTDALSLVPSVAVLEDLPGKGARVTVSPRPGRVERDGGDWVNRGRTGMVGRPAAATQAEAQAELGAVEGVFEIFMRRGASSSSLRTVALQWIRVYMDQTNVVSARALNVVGGVILASSWPTSAPDLVNGGGGASSLLGKTGVVPPVLAALVNLANQSHIFSSSSFLLVAEVIADALLGVPYAFQELRTGAFGQLAAAAADGDEEERVMAPALRLILDKMVYTCAGSVEAVHQLAVARLVEALCMLRGFGPAGPLSNPSSELFSTRRGMLVLKWLFDVAVFEPAGCVSVVVTNRVVSELANFMRGDLPCDATVDSDGNRSASGTDAVVFSYASMLIQMLESIGGLLQQNHHHQEDDDRRSNVPPQWICNASYCLYQWLEHTLHASPARMAALVREPDAGNSVKNRRLIAAIATLAELQVPWLDKIIDGNSSSSSSSNGDDNEDQDAEQQQQQHCLRWLASDPRGVAAYWISSLPRNLAVALYASERQALRNKKLAEKRIALEEEEERKKKEQQDGDDEQQADLSSPANINAAAPPQPLAAAVMSAFLAQQQARVKPTEEEEAEIRSETYRVVRPMLVESVCGTPDNEGRRCLEIIVKQLHRLVSVHNRIFEEKKKEPQKQQQQQASPFNFTARSGRFTLDLAGKGAASGSYLMGQLRKKRRDHYLCATSIMQLMQCAALYEPLRIEITGISIERQQQQQQQQQLQETPALFGAFVEICREKLQQPLEAFAAALHDTSTHHYDSAFEKNSLSELAGWIRKVNSFGMESVLGGHSSYTWAPTQLSVPAGEGGGAAPAVAAAAASSGGGSVFGSNGNSGWKGFSAFKASSPPPPAAAEGATPATAASPSSATTATSAPSPPPLPSSTDDVSSAASTFGKARRDHAVRLLKNIDVRFNASMGYCPFTFMTENNSRVNFAFGIEEILERESNNNNNNTNSSSNNDKDGDEKRGYHRVADNIRRVVDAVEELQALQRKNDDRLHALQAMRCDTDAKLAAALARSETLRLSGRDVTLSERLAASTVLHQSETQMQLQLIRERMERAGACLSGSILAEQRKREAEEMDAWEQAEEARQEEVASRDFNAGPAPIRPSVPEPMYFRNMRENIPLIGRALQRLAEQQEQNPQLFSDSRNLVSLRSRIVSAPSLRGTIKKFVDVTPAEAAAAAAAAEDDAQEKSNDNNSTVMQPKRRIKKRGQPQRSAVLPLQAEETGKKVVEHHLELFQLEDLVRRDLAALRVAALMKLKE